MADIGTLTNYTGGSVLYAAALNSDFGAIRTVVNGAVVHTDKASQVVTKTLTFTPDSGEAFTVSTGGATITAGGLTITAGGLTVTAGGITSSGTAAFANVTASGTLGVTGASTLAAVSCTTLAASGAITGTLGTAAQTNITSLGTLTALTISGTLTLSNASPLSLAATAKFVVGATAFSIKDSGDGVTAFGITGTGTATAVVLNGGSSGSITATGNNGNSVILSGGNSRLVATSGVVLLGTDGTNPATASTTVNLPCMPYVSTPPSGSLGSGKVGAFCMEPGDNKLWIWSGSAWKYATLT